MNYSTILVPLDGSPQAERAVPVAARITRSAGGSIALVQVVRAPVEVESGAAPPAAWTLPARPEEHEMAQRYLANVREAEIPAEMSTQIHLMIGPPAAMIQAASVGLGADLIVMTSHGRTGLGRWLLGSVTAEVARESRIPVLVVRGSGLTRAPGEDSQRPLSALVPLDGSLLAEAALHPALRLLGALANPAPISLHLLAVVEPLPLTETAALGRGIVGEGHVALTGADQTMLREAEQYLCATAKQMQRDAQDILSGQTLSVTCAAVCSPDIAHTILTTAEAGVVNGERTLHPIHWPPSNLAAMATHGRGGLTRWVMGSITDRVLHATHLPLLVVRPAVFTG